MSKLKLVLDCAIDLHKHLETEFPKCEFKANVSKGGELVEVILTQSPESPIERKLFEMDLTESRFWKDIQEYIYDITSERREQLNFDIKFDISPRLKKITNQTFANERGGRKMYERK